MSNRARGGGGEQRRARSRAGLTARMAAAALIAMGGSTLGWNVAPGVVTAAQPPGAEPATDGGFTAEQAAAGWSVYARECGECHGLALDGAEAPALRGVDFLNGWAGRTTDELFEYVRDGMPPGLGGSLGDPIYLDLVAYLLDANGARPGDAPLTAGAAVPIGDAADVAEARRAAEAGERPRRRPARFVNREVPYDLTPVTDALLGDPPPGDWLSWRRTRDSHGYSPLDQVTRGNVDQLRLAWVLSIRDGNHQTTPLVHDGVMFLASPGNVVQAIDAATGDVIWQYRSPLPEDAPQRAATPARWRSTAARSTWPRTMPRSLPSTRGPAPRYGAPSRRTTRRASARTPARSSPTESSSPEPTAAAATRSRPASSPATTPTRARSCGGRRRSRCRGIPMTPRGATRLPTCARAATRGSRAATIRTSVSSTSGRRRPSRGWRRAAA